MQFEEIYNEHFSRIFMYIRKHIVHQQDSEDLTAEVFLAAYRNWDAYDPKLCPVAAWLYMIASCRLKNFYRDRKKIVSFDEAMSYGDTNSENYCEAALELMDNRRTLAVVIKALNDREQQIIVQKYFLGLTNQEIADELKMTQGNVRVVCTRALRKMRSLLPADAD